MLPLLRSYLQCELRHKANVMSYVSITLGAYFILQMGFNSVDLSLKSIHAVLWFILLYLMLFIAISTHERYRSNDFEKGLVIFTHYRHKIFFVKIIVHLILLIAPVVLLFVLLALQGISFSAHAYGVYALGTVLLSVMSQLLTGLLAQLPNKDIALPLILFPVCMPIILFLYSVVIKSASETVGKELWSCVGMILIALSIGYITSEISLEE